MSFLARACEREVFSEKTLRKVGKGFSEATIKAAVFELLDKNPLLTAQPICQLLGLSYKEYRNYVTKLRSLWRTLPRNERGSKCSSVHGWRGWCHLPSGAAAGIRS